MQIKQRQAEQRALLGPLQAAMLEERQRGQLHTASDGYYTLYWGASSTPVLVVPRPLPDVDPTQVRGCTELALNAAERLPSLVARINMLNCCNGSVCRHASAGRAAPAPRRGPYPGRRRNLPVVDTAEPLHFAIATDCRAEL